VSCEPEETLNLKRPTKENQFAMSLDSLFKQDNKKKNHEDFADDAVSGEFRSRSEEDTLAASEASGRSKASKAKRSASPGNSRKSSVDDAALPEKKRARRRLIGAVALVLAAVIGLPMIFDSEPNASAPKIAIEIPSKDDLQTKPQTTTPLLDASKNLNQGIDPSEEVVVPAPAVTSGTTASVAATKDPRAIVSVDANAKAASLAQDKLQEKKNELVATSKAVIVNPPTATNKVTPESAKKTEVKVEPKTEVKQDKVDDATRALALLEGRSLPEDKPKNEIKANKADASSGSFVVQVAALNSAAKVKELQSKLKAANITSYTQKIVTTNGEVSRIRVGPFANKAEAEKMRAKLVKIGLNGSLVPN
jgi:DedD protein